MKYEKSSTQAKATATTCAAQNEPTKEPAVKAIKSEQGGKEEVKVAGATPLQNNASATSVKHASGKDSVGSGHILKRSGSSVTTKQVLKANSSADVPLLTPTKIEKQSQSSTLPAIKAKDTGKVSAPAAPDSKLPSATIQAKKKQLLKDGSTSQSAVVSQSKTSLAKQASCASSVERQNQATPVKRQTGTAQKASAKQATSQASKAQTAKQSQAAAANAPDIEQDKLVDKWPTIHSAADWNREEKEREIRENLAKMAGITIGAPSATPTGKQPNMPKGVRAKLINQQQLNLEHQYQQQNFATLTSFDANKKIRVGQQYQVEVKTEDYPGGQSQAPVQKQPQVEKLNPEEEDPVQVPSKRPVAPQSAQKILSESQAKKVEKSVDFSGPQKRPHVGPQTSKRGPPKLVSHGSYGEDSDELKEYLELCDFIMREASSNLNGMLMRGSSQYQEKAMQVLTQHNYDYDLAKFSILYPTVLLIPETRARFMAATRQDPTLLSKIVREAVQDLKGCKQDEIDEAVGELRQLLANRIKPEELALFEKKFKKMQIKFPDDIDQMLLDAEEFSKQVRKKINPNVHQDKRLTLEQLQDLQEMGQAQCLETPELLKLDAQVQNAQEWLAKVEQFQEQDIALKDLEKLVRTGKQLPVKFGEPYDALCQRLNKALDLQRRIQATFKSNKTRGAVQGPSDSGEGRGPTRGAAKNQKSNHGMYQEELNEVLQREGLSLKVNFKDLDELTDLIDRVRNWKHYVGVFLDQQSIKQQMRKRLKFKNYLNEAKLLKLALPLVVRLQRQASYIEWREQVNSFWRKALKHSAGKLGEDQQLIAELESIKGPDEEGHESNDVSSERSSSKKNDSEKSSARPNEPTITAETQVHVQGLVFTMLKDDKGETFAEVASHSKIELSQMRQLIENMISKGFYESTAERLPLSSQESIIHQEAQKCAEKLDDSKVASPQKEGGDEEVKQAEKASIEQDGDVEMKEAQEPKPAIGIDADTGSLSIDEKRFALCEKPYTVQLLLLKYKEFKELSEQLAEIVEEITDIQSAGSISQLLTSQNEANFELFDINELHDLWLKCSSSFIQVPQLADFFNKIQLVADCEKAISAIKVDAMPGLKAAFAQIYSCCRTGVKTTSFAKLYSSVQTQQLWCHQARQLSKEYYKTIELKHNHLNLIDSQLVGKPFERKNPFVSEAADPDGKSQLSHALDTTLSDYTKVQKLLKEAEKDELSCVRQSNEFAHLQSLAEKLKAVTGELQSLKASLETDQELETAQKLQNLNRMDHLLTLGIPLDPEVHASTSRLLKVERWKMRLTKLKQSKSVTIKQIESLLKESKSHAVQKDPECRMSAFEVEQKSILCRQWLNRFESIEDINDLTLVSDLIDEASTGQLGFVLEEFTLLKEDHYESLLQIRNSTESLFKIRDSSTEYQEAPQITLEGLKNLILLKNDISDDQVDSKQNNSTNVAMQEPAQNQFATDGLTDLLDQKGNDMDLLQSMESLVEVWRAVSRRALTVAVHPVEPQFTISLKLSDCQYALDDEQSQICAICQEPVFEAQKVKCLSCGVSIHRGCLRLRQIGNGEEESGCLACQLRSLAEISPLSETPQEQFHKVAQEVFQWRRQRLSLDQLAVLIEVGETLLPTMHLPELFELREEKQRAQEVLNSLQELINQSSTPTSDDVLTRLINRSETLIIDLNKALWQAVLQTRQLQRLAHVKRASQL